MTKKKDIMDSSAMSRAINRISYEILERNGGVEDICVIGILSRGVILGKRIASKLSELEKCEIPFGVLDITNYRDDKKGLESSKKSGEKTNIDFDINNKKVILVDDVMFTGRSTRAALDALVSRGRPRLIQLAVLIDRGHRELPVRPDYVGKNVPTSKKETVKVFVTEMDGEDAVSIFAQ